MKKGTRRSPRSQARRLSAKVLIAGKSSVACNAFVIRAAKSPYGPRPRWGQIEFAQAAICALYPNGLPSHFNASALTDAVDKWLKQVRAYREARFREPVSRRTVLRAMKLLRIANR